MDFRRYFLLIFRAIILLTSSSNSPTTHESATPLYDPICCDQEPSQSLSEPNQTHLRSSTSSLHSTVEFHTMDCVRLYTRKAWYLFLSVCDSQCNTGNWVCMNDLIDWIFLVFRDLYCLLSSCTFIGYKRREMSNWLDDVLVGIQHPQSVYCYPVV